MSKSILLRPIVGPSHAVRLRHALATKQFLEFAIPSQIIGVGGMPIWSPRILKEIGLSYQDHDVFFIVGDFRFGNLVLNDPKFSASYPQEKEYLSIDKELINEKNDQILFDLCMTTIKALKLQLQGKLKLLFWDLSIREYENRSTGRYQESGSYRHPVWNLENVLSQFETIAIDSRDVLKVGRQLYIDSSAHPSFIGWIYISQLINGNISVDLSKLINTFGQALQRIFATNLKQDRVIITGNSKFTRVLEAYIQRQQFQLPLNWVIEPLNKAFEADSVDHCLYFPSLFTYEMDAQAIDNGITQVQKFYSRLASKHKKVSVLFYDNWAFESISKRRDYLNKYISKHTEGLTANLENAICPKEQSYRITDSLEFEGMIELNNTLYPTLLGLLEIFYRATTDQNHEEVMLIYNELLAECYRNN